MQNDKLLPATYDVEIAKTPTPDHPIPIDTQMYIKELESRFDRILEQLQEESDFFGGEPMGSLQKAYYCKGITKAIEIVKGGVDNANRD